MSFCFIFFSEEIRNKTNIEFAKICFRCLISILDGARNRFRWVSNPKNGLLYPKIMIHLLIVNFNCTISNINR